YRTSCRQPVALESRPRLLGDVAVTTNVLQSSTAKVLGIGFLALLMLIPLAQVQGLIGERSELRFHSIASIAQSWGREQHVGGPVLAIAKRVRVQTNNGWTTHASTEILLPDTLDIRGALAPELRSYGIYSAPVYTADLKITGRFLSSDIKALAGSETTYLW